jgi:hypothetical protein
MINEVEQTEWQVVEADPENNKISPSWMLIQMV